jgi:uncharacterized protein YjiS (DUF1127 family)
MLNSQSSIAAVRRHSILEQASRIASRDRLEIPAERSTPSAKIFKAEVDCLPETSLAMAQPDPTWPSLLWFFLEGFALYGASLHGLATIAVTAIGSEASARRPKEPPRRHQGKSISLVSPATHVEVTVLGHEVAIYRSAPGTRTPSTRDGWPSPAREVDRYRSVHPFHLAMIRNWRGIASRWAKRRREREVKEAVATLSQYDDRTLRDIGILHRSQIVQIVRYGRDT